jgi:hypothetical protein
VARRLSMRIIAPFLAGGPAYPLPADYGASRTLTRLPSPVGLSRRTNYCSLGGCFAFCRGVTPTARHIAYREDDQSHFAAGGDRWESNDGPLGLLRLAEANAEEAHPGGAATPRKA